MINQEEHDKRSPESFRLFAHKISEMVGTSTAFIGALILIIVWLLTGPIFGFSDLWQLVINTATTIVTFLLVFIIQNTQNRDAKAIHLKLDELISSSKTARNAMVDLEDLSDAQLDKLQEEFKKIREKRSTSSIKES